MFLLYAVMALVAASVATAAWRRARLMAAAHPAPIARPQPLLVACTALCLMPPVLKAVFALWPAFEARALPIELHMLLGDEFWIPFLVVFFATVTFAVPMRARRALLLATWLAAALVISRGVWRLSEPAVYASAVSAAGGVCPQSTDYTRGAASMVMLLDRLDIPATEGEMARLSVTVPRRGISAFQAAYALQRSSAKLVGRAACMSRPVDLRAWRRCRRRFSRA